MNDNSISFDGEYENNKNIDINRKSLLKNRIFNSSISNNKFISKTNDKKIKVLNWLMN